MRLSPGILATGCFAVAAAVVVAFWAMLGAPVSMPVAPLAAGDKLACVSYAPFRNAQSPLEGPIVIERSQIEDDLTRLAKITNCVRTYSVDFGLDQVPEVAQRHGLKVIQGLWLSSHADRNRYQIETTVALANRFPGVIEAVVVGNEVLLRGEMSGDDVATTIRAVKARVPMPVTYADVWEFWLRFPKLYDAVDFVTIHVLPYWEDIPIPAAQAAAHVDAIHRKVATAYPGKDILIGEVGWPSAGRMRAGAEPSPSSQALVVQEVLALAKRENYRVNIIEAFDQPWKRRLEGTVGGFWGLLDNDSRTPKFAWGKPVSNHPHWPLQAIVGVILAAAVFAAALRARLPDAAPRGIDWLAVTVIAIVGGVLSGWAMADATYESLGVGGWLRSVALCIVAVASPLLAAAGLVSRRPIPTFASILADTGRMQPVVRLTYGITLIALAVLAVQVALGLVFDPRYKDFPFAALTAGAVPFFIHGLFGHSRGPGGRGLAECVVAAALALSVVYIVPNEGLANWQSLWLCGALVALAFTLVRVRGAPD
ncbi:MAG TPA: beta-(1-6) glucans synthase [Xanthobacteraceae bacterium]|nr:beta-(1-6) glucans synthase [Xanthobacteraceae bacterium]